MKKFVKMWFTVILCIMIFTAGDSVRADEYGSCEDYYAVIEEGRNVYDFAELLSETQENALQKEIKKAVEASKLDIVILTADETFEKDTTGFADDFFDRGGFGYEDDKVNPSGVLLLVDMDAREIYLSTAGIGIFYLNDSIIECILDDITEDASNEEYKKLCDEFIEDVVYFSQMARSTKPYQSVIAKWYDRNYADYNDFEQDNLSKMTEFRDYVFDYDRDCIVTGDEAFDVYHMKYEGFAEVTFFSIFRMMTVDLLIGLIAAIIVVCCLKNPSGKKMTVDSRTYQEGNKLEVLSSRDEFVRRTTRTYTISSSSSGSHGNGGGGSHHSSSGGASHGGGGRKF